jgi:hypothetical protein
MEALMALNSGVGDGQLHTKDALNGAAAALFPSALPKWVQAFPLSYIV